MRDSEIDTGKRSGFTGWLSKVVSLIFPSYAAPILISLILLAGHLLYGMLENYMTVVVAVGTSLLAEYGLSRGLYAQKKNMASAYITGISVSILIRSTLLWPYALTALLSILSKYVFRYKGKHIWNPSNLGISWMLFTVPFYVSGLSIQWGSNLLPNIVIWCLGLVIVTKAKRFFISIPYVLSFVSFAYLRSQITGDTFLAEVAPLSGPMYQLFVLFMITDPATTPNNRKSQVVFALAIAFVEFILRLNHLIYAPFYALFLVGPIMVLITRKSWNSNKSKMDLQSVEEIDKPESILKDS